MKKIMVKNKNMKAVVLAAGEGTRIKLKIPKPLVIINGLSLLERTILTFADLNVQELVIVVGYQADKIKGHVANMPIIQDYKITWVENREFHRGNGLSVLLTQDYVGDRFFLSMVDHIYDSNLFFNLLFCSGDLVCVIDSQPRFADLADATKVLVQDGKIQKIGKGLTEFNGLDCGMFLCSRKIFPILEETIGEGKEEWDDAKEKFAERFKLDFFDIRGALWLDVDTPKDAAKARKLLSKRE
ncbi:NTP transferase domain-containing protein [Candidatus Aerophobetes bacterium]|nr:NTP transferase domain-containing protein [Candidatus Aerophobetes bacterium]